MNRRKFSKSILGAGLMISTQLNEKHNSIPYLQRGDKIGLVCPAGPISAERLAKAISNLESIGLFPVPGKYILEQYGYLAGTDMQRLEDFMSMFQNKEIKAVWCIRGGYGSTRLLEKVDFSILKKNPKLLIGYSDITAFHNTFHTQLKFTSIHGPVASSDFTDYTTHQLSLILFGKSGDRLTIKSSMENELMSIEGKKEFEQYTIIPGKTRGRLIGGNLSLLAALTGTRYWKIPKDSLLFIEDVGEEPYRLDRMITQLLQTLPLSHIKGIILGVFVDCEKKEDSKSLSLKEMFIDRLGNLSIPVKYGYSFGHISNQCTLPIGAYCDMNTDNSDLILTLP